MVCGDDREGFSSLVLRSSAVGWAKLRRAEGLFDRMRAAEPKVFSL